MAWPALLWLSSYVLLASMLAEVESRTTTERRVGKGLGILLHYAKESNERNTKPKLMECGVTRPEVRTLNNWCSFSLENRSHHRMNPPLEKDAPPYMYLDRQTRRILIHLARFSFLSVKFSHIN